MPRTKRRFADDDPPTDDSSDDPPDEDDEPPVMYRRMGGGKQLRVMGGGKQLRPAADPSDDEDDDDDSDDSSSEEEVPPPQTSTFYRGGAGGKQLRPPGGKQLRVAEPESDSDDDDEDDDEDEEETKQPQQSVSFNRGGGKSLARMQHHRGGGKQLRPTIQEDDDDSDSEEDSDEMEEAPAPAPAPSYGGKQLRRPPPKKMEDSESDEEDDDDMEIDDSDEDEEKKPQQPSAPAPYRGGKMLRRPPSPQPEKSKEKPAEPAPKAAPKRAAAKEPEDMEESSEDESSDEERELDMETFDTQQLVKGEEDQKYLDSLPEFEREAILGERFEKLKNEADMKKALRESKRKEREERKAAKAGKTTTKKKAAKAKAAVKKATKTTADTDGDAALAAKLADTRESQRNRDAKGAKSKKAAALAAFREERRSMVKKKDEEEEEDDSDLDFGDDDDESDDDYDEQPTLKPWQQKRKPTTRTSSRLADYSESSESDQDAAPTSSSSAGPEAELADYVKVTIPRRRLAQWCNEPYFESVVTNCFVRLAIGESNGKKCYRLCEIVGVVPSKSEYKFPATDKQKTPVSTNKALRLRMGKNEREFPMFLTSDSRPNEEDVKRYIGMQKDHRQQVLSKRQAVKLRKNLDDIVHNYQYTNEDIEKALESQKKRGKGIRNIGLEQTRIKIAVQAARSGVEEAKRRLGDLRKNHLEFSGDAGEANELEKAIQAAELDLENSKQLLEEKLLDEERIKAKAKDRKNRLTKRAKDKNWAKVNQRAAKVNQTADFESYKAERERQKNAMKNADGTEKFNPYARRKVKPKILWEVGQTNDKAENGQVESKSKETRDEAATDVSNKATGRDENGGILLQQDAQKAELVGQGHQFAIDEEVLAARSTSSALGGMFGTDKPLVKRVRKGISLKEYQERKEAGTL